MFAVEIARTSQSGGKVTGLRVVAPPVSSDIIAVAAVPLSPAQAGKRANLIRACRIPSLSDDLRIGQQRILCDHFHDGWIGENIAIAIAAEDTG